MNAIPGRWVTAGTLIAARYPCRDEVDAWTQTRLPDGTPARP